MSIRDPRVAELYTGWQTASTLTSQQLEKSQSSSGIIQQSPGPSQSTKQDLYIPNLFLSIKWIEVSEKTENRNIKILKIGRKNLIKAISQGYSHSPSYKQINLLIRFLKSVYYKDYHGKTQTQSKNKDYILV